MTPTDLTPDPAPSRRRFLQGSGLLAAAATLGVGGGLGVHAATRPRTALVPSADEAGAPSIGTNVVPFHASRQAGVAKPAQAHLVLTALDVRPGLIRPDLVALLKRWTTAAAAMTRGEPPELDGHEADGLGPASLTVTVGFGSSLFATQGPASELGLARHRPAALVDLPTFRGDRLLPAHTGGDLIVQACADDPIVAWHAARTLVRLGRDQVGVRWQQRGFSRVPGVARDPASTRRNLLGQLDGSNNLLPGTAVVDEHVWITGPTDPDEPAWMHEGTYLVARRIRMHLDAWDRISPHQRDLTLGRKVDGGAVSGGAEHDPVDFSDRPAAGEKVPANAHIRLANLAFNNGARMLRRGYGFDDGVLRADDGSAIPDAGLLFMAFQRDPRTGFVPVQQRLAAADALNAFTVHVGSALAAIPPGARAGEYLGQTLLEA